MCLRLWPWGGVGADVADSGPHPGGCRLCWGPAPAHSEAARRSASAAGCVVAVCGDGRQNLRPSLQGFPGSRGALGGAGATGAGLVSPWCAAGARGPQGKRGTEAQRTRLMW